MFVLRYNRRQQLRNWMVTQLDEDTSELVKYLKHANEDRRYAVHITVDGLQGTLLQSLSQQKPEDHYLKKIQELHKRKRKLRLQTERTNGVRHKQNIEFLEHFVKKGFQNQDYLPTIGKIYKRYPSSISRAGYSSTPTISVRNLPLIYSGTAVVGPSSSGIPNFHFVEREGSQKRAYYFYGNDALLMDEMVSRSNMITMFERLKKFNTLNCNAQYDWHSLTSFDGLANLALGEVYRDFGDFLCLRELKKRVEVEKKLKKLRAELVQEIDRIGKPWLPIGLGDSSRARAMQLVEEISKLENQGLPQYLLYYNPWPDHFAHFKGPFSDEITSPTGELNRLDYWISEIIKAYNNAGVDERTLYGMAGDHGLAPIFYTLNPERSIFGALKKKGRRLKIKKISSDEGEGPKINHALSPESMKGFDVVVASTAGGNYMMDFFKSQEDLAWSEQPLYDDLTKLKLLDKKGSINMIHEILSNLKESLDYAVTREAKCSLEKAEVRLSAYRHGQRHDEFIRRVGKKIYYKPGSASLLNIKELNPYKPVLNGNVIRHLELLKKCIDEAKENEIKTWCNESDWTELTSFTERPDSVVQLSHLYDTPRAGTLNLFPKEGIGYNTIVPGRHAGESFHEKDAFVGFWGRPVAQLQQKKKKHAKRLRTLANGSVAPTLYEFVSGQRITADDQFGFPSVLEDILTDQLRRPSSGEAP
jgi:hypothetical protein